MGWSSLHTEPSAPILGALPEQLRSEVLTTQLPVFVSQLLDHSAIAVFLVTATGETLPINRFALALLADEDGLSLREAHLQLSRRRDNQDLQERVNAICQGTKPGCDADFGLMIAARPSGRRVFAILVAPLRVSPTHGESQLVNGYILVADLQTNPTLSMENLRALYALTPAEGRLAVRLAAGDELRTAATTLGVTYGTARTTLGAIFRKTHTRRQSDLIRLLTRLTPLLLARP